jgi:hypothetical protein
VLFKLYNTLNEHRKTAYRGLLSNVPCKVGILPGGPGAGKTHCNLVVTCMSQARNIETKTTSGSERRGVKVLYLLDINKPLDDTANKIVNKYTEMGMNKTAVRIYSWPYCSKGGHENFNPKLYDAGTPSPKSPPCSIK